MNRENLQKMADYIRTIPQEQFDMSTYRTGDKVEPHCNSVGCVVGHCTALEDTWDLPYLLSGDIDFTNWSKRFTGFTDCWSESEPDNDGYTGVPDAWSWCFGYGWYFVDNTPEGAALRIEWLINNGLPEDWKEQLRGNAKLCYL